MPRIRMRRPAYGEPTPGRNVHYPKGWEGEVPDHLAQTFCDENRVAERLSYITVSEADEILRRSRRRVPSATNRAVRTRTDQRPESDETMSGEEDGESESSER